MAIDPSIPLRGMQPIEPIDYAGAYQKAAGMKNQQMQIEQNRMTLDKMRRDLQDEIKARAILKDANPQNIRQLIPKLYSEVGPNAPKYLADIANQNAAFAKMDEADLDLIGKRTGYLANTLYGIRNAADKPAAYKQAKKMILDQKIMNQDEVAQLPAEYPGDDVIDMMAMINTDVKTQMAAQTARIRAESYANNIASLSTARENKSLSQLKRDQIAAQDLQRKINSDAALDERERARLSQQMTIQLQNLAERISEEEGRNKRYDTGEAGRNARFEKAEAGKAERTRLVQDRMDQRQQVAIEKGFSPTQIAQATHYAIRDMGYANLEDVDDENVEEFNSLVESYLNRQTPKLGTKPGGFAGFGTDTTITPGAEVNPRPKPVAPTGIPAAAPAPQAATLPPQAVAQLKTGVNTTFANGQVWTLDAQTKQPKRVK